MRFTLSHARVVLARVVLESPLTCVKWRPVLTYRKKLRLCPRRVCGREKMTVMRSRWRRMIPTHWRKFLLMFGRIKVQLYVHWRVFILQKCWCVVGERSILNVSWKTYQSSHTLYCTTHSLKTLTCRETERVPPRVDGSWRRQRGRYIHTPLIWWEWGHYWTLYLFWPNIVPIGGILIGTELF